MNKHGWIRCPCFAGSSTGSDSTEIGKTKDEKVYLMSVIITEDDAKRILEKLGISVHLGDFEEIQVDIYI